MNPVDDTRLYTIGELARRTGLSVKTIRFYADAGVVPPTDRTHAGYRLYDVAAITKLELVRTLRELGAGLDDVQRVLASEATLTQLAAKHLELVEGQLRTLRIRRAVLRAVVKLDSTTEEVRLMHKLATMSDEDRNRLIEEFWDDVTSGLELDPSFTDWIRSARPNLPEDPTSEQVEAWIELAELVQTPDFRQVVSGIYREISERHGSGASTAPQTPEVAKQWWELIGEVKSAYDAKVPTDSERARELVDRVATHFAAEYGQPDGRQLRERVAAEFERHFDQRVEHFWTLLAVINDWPQQQPLLGQGAKWLAAALRESAR